MSDDNHTKFETGQWLSLEKYLQMSMAPVQSELATVRSALEKLAVSTAEHDHLKYQVSALSELLQDLERMTTDQEERLSKVEFYAKIAKWLFGIICAIGMAILSHWTTSFIP